MDSRTTPRKITSLLPNEVFVFGSNLSGYHGAGAAKDAMKWGAVYGNPYGFQGNTYAIPTKDRLIRNTLPLGEIQSHVNLFINVARNTQATFLVTEIGCGLAGLTPEQVAPMFKEAVDVPNIFLPERFWNVLNNLAKTHTADVER